MLTPIVSERDLFVLTMILSGLSSYGSLSSIWAQLLVVDESAVGALDVFDGYLLITLSILTQSILPNGSPSHPPPKPPHAVYSTASNRNSHSSPQEQSSHMFDTFKCCTLPIGKPGASRASGRRRWGCTSPSYQYRQFRTSRETSWAYALTSCKRERAVSVRRSKYLN